MVSLPHITGDSLALSEDMTYAFIPSFFPCLFLPYPFVFSNLSFILSPDSPLFVPWVFLLGPQVSASRLQSYEVSHLFLFVAEVGLPCCWNSPASASF